MNKLLGVLLLLSVAVLSGCLNDKDYPAISGAKNACLVQGYDGAIIVQRDICAKRNGYEGACRQRAVKYQCYTLTGDVQIAYE